MPNLGGDGGDGDGGGGGHFTSLLTWSESCGSGKEGAYLQESLRTLAPDDNRHCIGKEDAIPRATDRRETLEHPALAGLQSARRKHVLDEAMPLGPILQALRCKIDAEPVDEVHHRLVHQPHTCAKL